MSAALGVAVVGAGYWGPNLARNFACHPSTSLRWVCDLDRDRAAALASQHAAQVTDCLDDILDDPEVDAVAVATPAATHTPLVLAALEAGKHVLVEKPLASSVSDGEKLVRAAEDRGLVLMCDHTYCYTPAVRRIRQLVEQGALGDVHYVDSVRINLGLVQPDVDVFWDLAPHDLSILDFVLGDRNTPISVAASAADPIGAGVNCVGYLSMPLTQGAIAHAHVNWLSPTKVRTTIVGGSRRTVVWDDLHPYARLAVHDRGVDLGAATGVSRRDRLVSYRSGDMVAPSLPEGEALREVVTEFCAAIRERRPAATDGHAGLRVLRILEAAGRSLDADGRSITLAVPATVVDLSDMPLMRSTLRQPADQRSFA